MGCSGHDAGAIGHVAACSKQHTLLLQLCLMAILYVRVGKSKGLVFSLFIRAGCTFTLMGLRTLAINVSPRYGLRACIDTSDMILGVRPLLHSCST
jgi:hypothetical protein